MNTTVKRGILSVTISDENGLYNAFMPFLKNGGLFIPTEKNYQLGQEVFVLLTLLDEPDKIPISGNVVWITPKGSSHTNHTTGIGIHFNNIDNAGVMLKGKIENHLVEKLKSDKITHTM